MIKLFLHIIMWKIAIISKKINSGILMRTGKTLSLMQSQKPSKNKIYRPQSTQAPKETVIKTEETDGSHDIDWTQTDDDTKYESHGMHVTGIVAGNSKEAAATGERFLGIAPEAQVMFMRVFANDVMGSAESLFIKAIEDAVALGADVINLSLGTANGAQLSGSKPLMEAIEKAKKPVYQLL